MAKKGPKRKPKKPYAAFPLTPHASGQWCKKIGGEIRYFGTDPYNALEKWHAYCARGDSVEAPAEPAPLTTVGDLVSDFLDAKKSAVETKELTHRTFADYYRSAMRLVGFFKSHRKLATISGDDLEQYRTHLAQGVSLVTLKRRVIEAKLILNFASQSGGREGAALPLARLAKPATKKLRIERQRNGRRYFQPAEIRALLEAAGRCGTPTMKAMILLGINAGLGNGDLGGLTRSAVDLESGWLDYPRPKTGIDRKCPLWPETVDALKAYVEWVAARPAREVSDGAEKLLFVTRKGLPYVRQVVKQWPGNGGEEDGKYVAPLIGERDAIATSFSRLMAKCSIRLPGVGFYGLRHSFETFGSQTGDKVAVDHIMGHAIPASDMSGVYRGYVSPENLLRVTQKVREIVVLGVEQGSQKPDRAA